MSRETEPTHKEVCEKCKREYWFKENEGLGTCVCEMEDKKE